MTKQESLLGRVTFGQNHSVGLAGQLFQPVEMGLRQRQRRKSTI